MKVYFLFIVFLVVLYTYTAYAKSIQNEDVTDGEIKRKRDIETSTECKYVNILYNKNESFNCCTIVNEFNEGIICEDGHIVEL